MAEVLFDPSHPCRPVTRVRSTVLVASREAVHAAGHGARYEAALPADARRELEGAVVGTWLPQSLAAAHYRACDELGLTSATAAQIGRAANERLKGTLYGTFIRTFRAAGGTPWNVLPHGNRFWRRGYDGGALRITRLGPKDARVDVLACGLCESDYYRHALRGLSVGVIEIFCRLAYAKEVASSPDGVSYRYQWV